MTMPGYKIPGTQILKMWRWWWSLCVLEAVMLQSGLLYKDKITITGFLKLLEQTVPMHYLKAKA
jgi:hypothetical protein